jgi:hypothetical protein
MKATDQARADIQHNWNDLIQDNYVSLHQWVELE